MARKKRKARAKAKRTIKPRDPFWRERRAFAAKRVEGVKTYRRSASRIIERSALEDE